MLQKVVFLEGRLPEEAREFPPAHEKECCYLNYAKYHLPITKLQIIFVIS